VNARVRVAAGRPPRYDPAMKRVGTIFLLLIALGLVVLGIEHWLGPGERAAGAMPQQAYVWQRAWTDAVAQAVRAGGPGFDRLVPAELQIDFDCAESKLAGYRQWVTAIKAKVAPVPVTITALPCWLDRRAFKALAAAADGYVLQVHSLRKPARPEELMPLCDPAAARGAVEKAAKLRMPFRVALPTYGYVVAFDSSGRLGGLSAEGPSLRWPEAVQLRTVRADPVAMAALVRGWTQDRPRELRGIVWYRLPNEDDRLNWQGATLACVMSGRDPRPELRAEVRRSQPGLYEIDLFNAGSADAPLQVVVSVRHAGARLVACDALGGFERTHPVGAEVRFRAASGSALAPLPPGRRKPIAWLRLGDDREVQVHVSPLDS